MAAQRSLAKRLWYRGLRAVCRVLAVVLFRIRCHDRRRVPAQGPVLILSNHQSNLDPILVGVGFDRRVNFLARRTLYDFAPLNWLMNSLDTIPIDRDGSGLGGLKETLRRLRREEMVLIFPEGTRSRDGRLAPLKPGFCAVARRSGAILLPVAIEGAYEAWPRTRLFPRLATVHVQFGQPILPDQFADLDDQSLTALAQSRITDCHAEARRRRARASKLGGRSSR